MFLGAHRWQGGSSLGRSSCRSRDPGLQERPGCRDTDLVLCSPRADAGFPPSSWGQASSKDLTNVVRVVDLGFCLPASLEAR